MMIMQTVKLRSFQNMRPTGWLTQQSSAESLSLRQLISLYCCECSTGAESMAPLYMHAWCKSLQSHPLWSSEGLALHVHSGQQAHLPAGRGQLADCQSSAAEVIRMSCRRKEQAKLAPTMRLPGSQYKQSCGSVLNRQGFGATMA